MSACDGLLLSLDHPETRDRDRAIIVAMIGALTWASDDDRYPETTSIRGVTEGWILRAQGRQVAPHAD
jgi:hypothetical protein